MLGVGDALLIVVIVQAHCDNPAHFQFVFFGGLGRAFFGFGPLRVRGGYFVWLIRIRFLGTHKGSHFGGQLIL